MPTGKGAVGVPEDLCVVMGVQVNETRCYVHAIAVDDPSCVSMVDSADGRDATPGYSDISPHPRSALTLRGRWGIKKPSYGSVTQWCASTVLVMVPARWRRLQHINFECL